ncbi:hypothetical protein AAHE18_19G096900 [Arachis hypogaea]
MAVAMTNLQGCIQARNTPSRTNPCRRVPLLVSTRPVASCFPLLVGPSPICSLLPLVGSLGLFSCLVQIIASIGAASAGPDPKTVLPCFLSSTKSALSMVQIYCSCMSFLPQSPSASVTTSPVATITISGPTSFAPVIDAAIDVVEKSNGQYHVLVIIADGQVSRNPYIGGRKRLGPQEQATVNSIVASLSSLNNFGWCWRWTVG